MMIVIGLLLVSGWWDRLAQALQGMQRLDPARLYYKKYLDAQPKGRFAKNAKKAISQIDWVLGK